MFEQVEAKLRKLPDSLFISLLLLLAIIRVGPSPIGKPWVGWVYDAARAYPKSANYISYSPLPTIIAKVLHEPKVIIWWTLFAAILVIWFIAVMQRLKTLFPDNYRIFQIIFAASQVITLQTTFIGHYDNISVIAASLVFLWDSSFLIYLAALLAAGANPYMSFATGICVLSLCLGTKAKRHLKIGVIYTLVSFAMLIFLHIWFKAPAGGTRESIVTHEFGRVIKGSLGVWPFIFLGVLGPLWFLYIWLFAQQESSFGKPNKLFIFVGTFLIPAGMSFFILDHTRIGVVVGALPLFLYLIPELKFHINKLNKLPIHTSALLIWIIYPAIIVDTAGGFRLPYAKFIELLSK